ncbi:uncharacterized protein EDB91DRAFT_1154437 [Suillus paluster]|uniref:uncharacterized protein n=1 Tax=Suillus paluster TaxID=48578 RepID=UPI001B87556D|nr:uncharacterized protein EDB91DRAFT_1154437 [Suillus paluster]KAG1731314.1 hypothetical protein EDB91DRAFT_1154437 [Suillus paluster]
MSCQLRHPLCHVNVRLSPRVLEALQILKFSYRQERLCFTRESIAKEDDYRISGLVTQRAAEELIHSYGEVQ